MLGPNGRRLCGVVATLLVTAGCTGGEPPGADPRPRTTQTATTAAPPPDGPVRPSWSARLDLLTSPIVVGETAVVLTRARADEIDVVGVDTTEGGVRWRHPWSPGRVPTGFALQVETARDASGRELVILQRARRGIRVGQDAPLVAVDPGTGDIVARSDPISLSEPLGACPTGRDACSAATSPSGLRWIRFDLESGEVRDTVSQAPTTGRSIGPGGLYDDGSRPGERIGRWREGRPLWERPVRGLFGAGYSSDGGWSFELAREAGVYHGYLGWVPPDGARTYTFAGEAGARKSVSIRRIVGFSATTGRRLWQRRQVIPVDTCLDADATASSGLVVACYFRGAIDVRDDQWLVDDAGVLALDPTTGTVTWRVSAGRTDLVTFTPPKVSAAVPGKVLLDTIRGPTLVDLADGSLERLQPGDVLLCRGEAESVDYAVEYADSRTRYGDGLLRPCRPDGDRAPAPTRRSVELGGTAAPSAVRVVPTADGLEGYRLE